MSMKYFNLRLTNSHKQIKIDINKLNGVIVAGYEKESIKGHDTKEHCHIILHTTDCESTIRTLVRSIGYNNKDKYNLSRPYHEDEDENTGFQPSMRYACKGHAYNEYEVEILSENKAKYYHDKFWKIFEENQKSKRAATKKKTTSVIKIVTDYVSENKDKFIDKDGVILDEKIVGYIIDKHIEYRKPHNTYNVESLFNLCMGILNPHDEKIYIMRSMRFYQNGSGGSCSADTTTASNDIIIDYHKREKIQTTVDNWVSSSNIMDDLEIKIPYQEQKYFVD